MQRLTGRVAVVTGASRGIGAAIVRAFVEEGASVAFNGRSKEPGDALIKAIGVPDRTWFCQGSVTVTEDIEVLIDGAVERFGKLDILVTMQAVVAPWGRSSRWTRRPGKTICAST